MLVRRPIILAVLLSICATTFLVARYGLQDVSRLRKVADDSWDTIHKVSSPSTGTKDSCTEDLSWLDRYKFTSVFKYSSRDIITRPGAPDRPLVTQIDTPLFDEPTSVDLEKSKIATIKRCLPPLTLDVPHGQLPTPDASDMIFACQTTLARLRDSIQYFGRWLPDTGARLYCIVKENEETLANGEEMAALEKEYHDLGMDVRIVHPLNETDAFEQRYFSLVNVMYAARDEKTKWMITVDDDTFFPSLHELRKMLARFDETQPLYISALSENWWAVDHYGLMGFGGASIILSVPMVKIMDEHTHECKDKPRLTSGDATIMDCIYRFSTTKLTNIPELYQLDIKKDLSGFYESGRPVLSLHHWKAGPEKVELEKTHLIADICDDCYLQRWQFPNDLILSNGFSIHTYPKGHLRGKTGIKGIKKGVEKIDLLQMEETWDENFNVVHSLNPLRVKLSPQEKKQYLIMDTFYDTKGDKKVLRQVYVHKGGKTGMDEVMVLNWMPGDPAKGST